MAYGDFKYLTRRTAFDKMLRDKVFNAAKYPKRDGYKCELAPMVYQFFDKNLFGTGIKNENISDQQLVED